MLLKMLNKKKQKDKIFSENDEDAFTEDNNKIRE